MRSTTSFTENRARRTFEDFESALEQLYAKYTPEFAESESGVPAAMIVEAAEAVASAGTAFSAHNWRASAAGNLGDVLNRRFRERSTTQVGLQDDSGGIEDWAQRGTDGMAEAVGNFGAEAMQLKVEGIFGMVACFYFAAEILQGRTEGLSDELAGVGLLEGKKIRAKKELAHLGQLAIEMGRIGLHGLTAQDNASEGGDSEC